MLTLSNEGIFQTLIEAGMRLADTPEAEGGWSEYFSETEDCDLRIQDDVLRAHTAIMMENAKRWMSRLCRKRLDERGRLVIDETTRSALVGGWSDYLFPIIRASFPTNPINDIVSVQPTTKRTATIMYWNWVVGNSKGGEYYPGQRLFDANKGALNFGYHFTDEYVENEVVGTGTGASATIAGTLNNHDGGGVRPGTVAITAVVSTVAETVYDDGQGGFTGGVTGTINYATGAFSVTFSGNVDVSTNVTATYEWNSEGSEQVAQVDVQVTSSTAETQRRAILINHSIEAQQDLMAEAGVVLEPELVSGAAATLNTEIARQILASIWQVAPIIGTFATTGSVNYTQQDHFRDLVYLLNKASDDIENRTQKGTGNWIVTDGLGATMLRSLPGSMFEAAPVPQKPMGLHFIGTLLGRFRVYKENFLSSLPTAAAYGNMLMGFKGTQFHEAGFVYSPYQMLYTTETLTRANFVAEKGMATRYATKMVNPDMFVRINLGS